VRKLNMVWGGEHAGTSGTGILALLSVRGEEHAAIAWEDDDSIILLIASKPPKIVLKLGHGTCSGLAHHFYTPEVPTLAHSCPAWRRRSGPIMVGMDHRTNLGRMNPSTVGPERKTRGARVIL
jgi:hypothetical protein